MKSQYATCRTLLFIVLAIFSFLHSLNTTAQVSQDWDRRFGVRVSDMALDQYGNVIVVGGSRVAKYNAAGSRQWLSQFFGEGYPNHLARAVALDSVGNVYVVGHSAKVINDTANFDAAIAKFNSNGILQWSQTFDIPIDNMDRASLKELIVTKDGSVFAVGTRSVANSTSHLMAIKYNTNGVRQWAYTTNEYSFGGGIGVDRQNNVLLSGTGYDQDFHIQDYAIKLNEFGVQQWMQVRPSIDWRPEAGHQALVVDDSSNLYVIGNYGPVKYDSDGNLLWGTGSGYLQIQLESLVLDDSGNVYTVGTHNSGTLVSVETAKYSPDGKIQWEKRFGQPGDHYNGGNDIDLDNEGNIYVTGYRNWLRNGNFLTIKYDRQGELQWTKEYDGPAGQPDYASRVKVDDWGNVYVAGGRGLTPSRSDAVLIKYRQSASPVVYGVCCFDNGNGPQAICGINVTPVNCAGSGNNAFFAGYVSDCSVIDTINLCAKTPSIVRIFSTYNETQNSVELQWNNKTEKSVSGYYVLRSADGKSYKTIGFVNVNTEGKYQFLDMYPEVVNYYKLVWFDPNGFESNAVLALAMNESTPRLFPNPATNRVKVVLKELEQNNAVLTVIDQYGRIKLTRQIQKGTVPELIVASLSAGIYYVQVDVNGKRFRQKLIKN